MRVTNTKKAGCFYGRLSGIPPPHPAQALAQDICRCRAAGAAHPAQRRRLLWKHLHREQSPAAVQGPTIFQQELQSSEWNTISYTPARRLTVQTTSAGSTAMDFRLAALDRTTAVDRSYFANVCFLATA